MPSNKATRPDLISGFHSRGALPHLKQEHGSYFVTFRLAGTLPKEVLVKFKAERESLLPVPPTAMTWHQREQLFRWYSSRVDAYLDAGHGPCWMRRGDIADLVANALQFHNGVRFELQAWTVMPNHVHAVLRPLAEWSLSRILQGWKGYLAFEANRLLERTGQRFWQSESFDHLIRDEEDFQRCCHYTIMNPVSAGLCSQPEDWKWSSAHRAAM